MTIASELADARQRAGRRMPTRAEHMQWVRARAFEKLETGDVYGAFASFHDDVRKHPETVGHPAVSLATAEMVAGRLTTVTDMARFIRQHVT